ncbi:MAG: hypothetical protein MAGBODY4_01110 [Candidatus Marinimicrobia bacterium]|nr:hypothetical protein [Candidatus Neomarinimicrobiota bacterium]
MIRRKEKDSHEDSASDISECYLQESNITAIGDRRYAYKRQGTCLGGNHRKQYRPPGDFMSAQKVVRRGFLLPGRKHPCNGDANQVNNDDHVIND